MVLLRIYSLSCINFRIKHHQDETDGMTSTGFEVFMADVSCGVKSEAEFDAVLDALVDG